MTKLMMIDDERVILNVQYSKIGYGYPRLFIEIGDKHYNLDLTVMAMFKMKAEDFADWAEDAEIVPAEEIEKLLKEHNINYAALEECVQEMKKG